MSVRREIDWEQVTEQAATLGGERMLFLRLYLASDLLGAPLPEKVWQRVQADTMSRVLAREVQERLYWDIDTPLSISYDLPAVRVSFHLSMRERLRDKIWYLVDSVTTPTTKDWTFLPLPAYLFPLYYVIRSVRLTLKYGRRLLERLS
jgi:hypothetical protein